MPMSNNTTADTAPQYNVGAARIVAKANRKLSKLRLEARAVAEKRDKQLRKVRGNSP